MNIDDIIIYTHEDPSIRTIDEFLSDPISIALGIPREDFLNFKNPETGETNEDSIFSEYTESEKTGAQLPTGLRFVNLLKQDTVLYLPKDRLNVEIVSIIGKNLVNTREDFNTFLSEEHVGLLQDPQYVQENRFKDSIEGVSNDTYPNITVWMWCRSLSNYSQEGDELTGSFIDITNYVDKLTTNVTKTGGNFSFNVAPLVCTLNDDGEWVVEKSSIQNYDDLGGNYAAESSIHRIYSDGNLKRNSFFLHNIVSSNDMVFIRFETLRNEVDKRVDDGSSLSIRPDQIPNNNYDMIGLVDSNRISTNPSVNDVTISITGRDLIKVWIEDGSYFFPIAYTSSGFTFNTEELDKGKGRNRVVKKSNRLLKRLGADGNYPLASALQYVTVEYAIKILINLVGHIGLVPDEVFNSYGDTRSKRYSLVDNVLKKKITTVQSDGKRSFVLGEDEDFEEVPLRGVWSIMKLNIDKNIINRRLSDSSITNPDGSLLNQIYKICQEPFVEFITDTYGDKFHMIVREPPFTGEAIKDAIDRGLVIDIEEGDVIQDTLEFNEDGAYSWYQLTPSASFIGSGSEVTLAYLPIVYFDEYANVFGNKRYSVVSNYLNYDRLRSKDQKDDTNYIAKQGSEDMKFLIDTTMYLPFTRKGEIVINGDRRIKRGTWVRYKGTGEICYVEAASNSASISRSSIDRTTTLSVSRCMVEDYVIGKEEEVGGKTLNVSYFNIIDTKTIAEDLFNTDKLTEALNSYKGVNIKRNMVVNNSVFNFFLKRRQMYISSDNIKSV